VRLFHSRALLEPAVEFRGLPGAQRRGTRGTHHLWLRQGPGTRATRPSSDWLGRPKIVHTDADGNVVGESKPDTDWLGHPKTVHMDAEGNVTGESRPDTDWLGQPKTVHADAEGNVTGESREATDLLDRRQTVRYDK
jgi:hypothetical protein